MTRALPEYVSCLAERNSAITKYLDSVATCAVRAAWLPALLLDRHVVLISEELGILKLKMLETLQGKAVQRDEKCWLYSSQPPSEKKSVLHAKLLDG